MENEKSYLAIRVVNAVAFLATVVVNFLAETIPFSGVTVGEISDRYPNLFTPADITFAIWGLIYLLLAAFVLFPFGVFGKRYSANPSIIRKITPWHVAASLMNISWLVAWHADRIGLSMIFMLLLLASLAGAYKVLENHRLDMVFADKLFIRFPFRVYFGWITVATVANFVILFIQEAGTDGFMSGTDWTIAVLVFTLAAALYVVFRFKDAAYGMVILWAYLGILFQHITGGSEGFARQHPAILLTLTACLVILFTATQVAIHRSRHRAGKEPEAGLLTK